MLSYMLRVARMTELLARRRVSWGSYRASLRPQQQTVLLNGGGVVFCDRCSERIFFQED